MKVTAEFQGGTLSLILLAETKAEQQMIGAVIQQPQGEQGCGYLDKTLISASLAYEGHFSNQQISRVRMSIYKPNDLDKEAK